MFIKYRAVAPNAPPTATDKICVKVSTRYFIHLFRRKIKNARVSLRPSLCASTVKNYYQQFMLNKFV